MEQLITAAAQSSRREQLLRALHETAVDLTAIRDSEAILKAIVRRTRQLIGSDMAYLSLNDYEKNETYIRMTVGVTTQAYRDIRMPFGTGVLGAVATGRAPAKTTHYLNDPTLLHLNNIDKIVAGEGVRSIMGVPLSVEGKVIGALLVANRYEHEFSREDVALVESIGTHAAVALDNAGIFDRLSDELQTAQSKIENLQQKTRSLEYEIQVLDRLITTLGSDHDFAKASYLLSQELGREVAILDTQGVLLAGAAELVTNLKLDPEQTQIRYSNSTDLTVLPISDTQILGTIVTRGELSKPKQQVLQAAGKLVAIRMNLEHSYSDALFRGHYELVDDLLGNTGPDTGLELRAKQYGLTDLGWTTVLAISGHDVSRVKLIASLRSFMGNKGIATVHGRHICVMAPVQSAHTQSAHTQTAHPQTATAQAATGQAATGQTMPAQAATGQTMPAQTATAQSAKKYAETMLTALKNDSIAATIAYSDPVQGFTKLRSAHTEADLILAAAVKLDRTRRVISRIDLGAAGMVLGATKTELLQELVRQTIGALIETDAERGSELTKTAYLYLLHGQNITQVAKLMNLHPNTLRQRIGRITELLETNWSIGSTVLDYQFALTLWKLGI